MDSVSFLQQQINEISMQIDQLNDKRAELSLELEQAFVARALHKYNLPNSDVPV